jgi:hypothetical protein
VRRVRQNRLDRGGRLALVTGMALMHVNVPFIALHQYIDMRESTSAELMVWCTCALRQGANFQIVWENLLKGNSLVCGEPRQRVEKSHPHMEVFLARGERLVFDIERHEFSLQGMSTLNH